ncbi:hypothetical protein FALBO_5645 [Fusarium albosuccineum]|uniref:Uncharacterized protein n=1 Tax=Fusarium albosuccineum TaxID=1237068 RepID=A0A8H4PE38_9HYPO|nr:hypothetical protein FALBO_5645 [Fusarium albosuccineum]
MSDRRRLKSDEEKRRIFRRVLTHLSQSEGTHPYIRPDSSFRQGDVKPLHTPQSTDSIYYKLLWWLPPLPWLNLAALASGRRLLPRFPGDVPPTAADLLSWAPAVIYVSDADGDDGDDDNADSEIPTSDDLASDAMTDGGLDTTTGTAATGDASTVPASTVDTTTAGSSTAGASTAPSTAAVTPAPAPALLGASVAVAPGTATFGAWLAVLNSMVYTLGQRPWEEKELARGRWPLPSSPPRREPEEEEDVADDEGVEDSLPASGATAPAPAPTTAAAASNSASVVPQLPLNTISGALAVPPAITALVVANIPSTGATEWLTGPDNGPGAQPARITRTAGSELA